MILTDADLVSRARAIRLAVTDCFGVLADREALDRFSLRDGVGVERLRFAGIRTVVITRERSTIVARRAEELGVERLYEGVEDKAACLAAIAGDANLRLEGMAYIGADPGDLHIVRALSEAGLTGCPSDVPLEFANAVNYQCRRKGGLGAFREFADWLLHLRSANDRAA